MLDKFILVPCRNCKNHVVCNKKKKKKKKKRGRYGYYFNVDGHSFLTDPLLSITKILSTT